MSKSLSNRLSLKIDLYDLKMKKGTNLNDHVSEFNRLMTQLISLEVKVDSERSSLDLIEVAS